MVITNLETFAGGQAKGNAEKIHAESSGAEPGTD